MVEYTLYGRLVNKEELKVMKATKLLIPAEEGQLIPTFYSPKPIPLLEYFGALQEQGKFRDTLKIIHKAFGGRGNAQFVVFFTSDDPPDVTGIPFRKMPLPNVYEAKFRPGTRIEIKEIL